MEGELSQKQQEQVGSVNLAFSGVPPVVRGVSHWADDANKAMKTQTDMFELLQIHSKLFDATTSKVRHLHEQLFAINARLAQIERERDANRELLDVLIPAINTMMSQLDPDLLEQYGLTEVAKKLTE